MDNPPPTGGLAPEQEPSGLRGLAVGDTAGKDLLKGLVLSRLLRRREPGAPRATRAGGRLASSGTCRQDVSKAALRTLLPKGHVHTCTRVYVHTCMFSILNAFYLLHVTYKYI